MADNAMQCGDYRKAIDVLRKIRGISEETKPIATRAMEEMPKHREKMHSPQWNKAHAFVCELFDLTHSEEDKIRPTKCQN